MPTELTVQAAPQPQPSVPLARPSWSALLVVLAGGFIAYLDFFVVNVAIPSMRVSLHADAAQTQLVAVGYGAALCVGLITGGRLGDLYGRRRLFLLGVGLFTLASAACGVAPSIWALVFARIVQGAAAALLTPQVLALVGTIYAGEARGTAFRAYGLMLGLSCLSGQLVGGLLLEADVAGLGWRGIFLVNVPIGVLVLALTARTVPESRSGARPGLDLVGAGLVSATLAALALPLLEGPQEGWPTWTWLSLAAAVPLLGLFLAHERRLAARGGVPLIDLELMRERSFVVGVVGYLTYFMSMGSFFLFVSLYLQAGKGLSPIQSALVFTLMTAGFFGSSFLAPRVAARLGRQAIAVGAGCVAAGYAVVALLAIQLGTTGEPAWIGAGLVIAGFGMGLVAGPFPSLVLAAVDPAHAGAASGMLSTAMEGGSTIGIAIVGAVFFDLLGSPPRVASYPHAFATSTGVIVLFALAVVALVQLLPRASGEPAAQGRLRTEP